MTFAEKVFNGMRASATKRANANERAFLASNPDKPYPPDWKLDVVTLMNDGDRFYPLHVQGSYPDGTRFSYRIGSISDWRYFTHEETVWVTR